MKVNVLMFNQDDPKKCTAAKLLRFGLVKKITKTSPTTLLLHPYAKNTLLSSDKNVIRSEMLRIIDSCLPIVKRYS